MMEESFQELLELFSEIKHYLCCQQSLSIAPNNAVVCDVSLMYFIHFLVRTSLSLTAHKHLRHYFRKALLEPAPNRGHQMDIGIYYLPVMFLLLRL